VVDGDKSLVVADKTLISVAERNIKKYDVVPLYYNMKKALPVILTNESIYAGLSAAFTGSNIGQYSNNISKIWNSEVFVSGSEEERKQAIDVIKLLCCENNFCIDRAKTLYMPERPKEIGELISSFTKEKVPYFFKYAKDKEEEQIAVTKNTFVNKLNSIIPNPRINCRSLGLHKPDYRLLMNNPNIECKVKLTDRGKIIKDNTDPLIIKYCELSKKYGLSLSNVSHNDKGCTESLKSSQVKHQLLCAQLINEIKGSLSEFGYTENEIVDILVKFLYGIRNSKHKVILWLCYGDVILINLQKHFKNQKKDVECIDCGKWFEINIKDNQTCRCPDCYTEYRRNYYKEKKREQRAKAKMSTNQ